MDTLLTVRVTINLMCFVDTRPRLRDIVSKDRERETEIEKWRKSETLTVSRGLVLIIAE